METDWSVVTRIRDTTSTHTPSDLLHPAPKAAIEEVMPSPPAVKEKSPFAMSEDEERELAELMDDNE